jgi:hypothetical protein
MVEMLSCLFPLYAYVASIKSFSVSLLGILGQVAGPDSQT